MDKDQKNQWKKDLWEVAATKSMIIGPENLIREITRGLINEKWWRICKIGGQCKVLKETFDVYLKKIQIQIWNKRCVESIELERQLENRKDDVFRLGIRDRKSWGSKVISNLVNT
ncbi:hypothetical protein RhiirA1_461690 [Rhizophagus irregularis]|uniref:Uncharacterized protein n=1 Tax=Rhizophagus irregularis TaxID=588596 RepID=A0A2N0RNR9_9GLOM|nr:hypothetical protein RhiirA1_461690 [Rhizophagus irregularis]CAB4474211.1 unnamed protein product [Rhizophagus irregularis]